MIFDKNERSASVDKRWVTGEIFGFEIPADAETLVSGGTDFLTKAFHISGALAANNRVSRIVEAEEFHESDFSLEPDAKATQKKLTTKSRKKARKAERQRKVKARKHK